VRMNELHRVLDRDDVTVRVLIPVADHCGKRGTLARARGAHKNDQAWLAERDLLEDERESQAFNRGKRCRNGSQHKPDTPLLNKCVGTKASDIWRGNRKIALIGAL